MKQQNYKNPILSGFYPDPSIVRVEEDYYLVNSTFSYFPGVPIHHSRDLVHWEQIGNVLTRKSQLDLTGADHGNGGIYAPTIRYHEGTFYMITTNVNHGGNFIVTATDPKGPWSDPYYLTADGIDPSLFFDDDGRCYYCGTKERREGGAFWGDNEIYIQELDLHTMQLCGESYAAWHGSSSRTEWAEGPHLYKKDHMYYLMIAEGGTGLSHAVTIARSEDLRKPFTGFINNPILSHRQLGRHFPIINTGHADLFSTQNGDWYMVLLASRPCNGVCNLGRETFLVPVTWEDGWPIVNPGKGIVEPIIKAPNLPYFVTSPKTELEDFNLSELPARFMTVRRSDFSIFDLTSRKGYLTMPLLPDTITEKEEPAALFVRQTAMSYDFETKLCFTPCSDSEEAGLTLYQSNNYHFRFFVRQVDSTNSLCVVIRENGNESLLAKKTLTDSSELCLHVTQHEQHLMFSWKTADELSYQTLVTSDAKILSTEHAQGFVGTCLGLYATCNHTESSNHAAFDYLYLKDIVD